MFCIAVAVVADMQARQAGEGCATQFCEIDFAAAFADS